MNIEKISLSLCDDEWELEYIDHDRHIVRGIVFDGEGDFYFVKVRRNDAFGNGTYIETAGGGVESGESLIEAIHRELYEELGADVDVVCELGEVSDYYNLIHRHNINHYFLCKVKAFGDTHLMPDEIEKFHLSVWKLDLESAVAEYERERADKWGRLLAKRELPILLHAKKAIENHLQGV